MSDETAAGAAEKGAKVSGLEMAASDRAILRELARQMAELAARPIEQEKRDLWYAHNALEPTRPVIFCDPENGWNEIITPDHIKCEGQLARGWEMHLRKMIFWGAQMCDDFVVTSEFCVPHVHTQTDYGLSETYTHGDSPGGSYVWDSPVKCHDDLNKLRFPTVTVDHGATEQVVQLARETFSDILNVRLHTVWWWSFGITRPAIRLRGLEQIMLDMYDNPDLLHRLMGFLRDSYLTRFEFIEREGLLFLNNDGTYVGSGGFGWSNELPQADFEGRVRTMDMWGFAESQETIGVSPALFEEFVFQYQLPLLERFGLNCYGCCEPVDSRWHILERIPRLRRVSVSPWSSVEKMAEYLGDRYIFSLKPNPSELAEPGFDEERIRAGLRRTFEATRDCRVEAIMKDNHTICRDPSRVIRWVRIAREEAERV